MESIAMSSSERKPILDLDLEKLRIDVTAALNSTQRNWAGTEPPGSEPEVFHSQEYNTECANCSKPATDCCSACKDAPTVDEGVPAANVYYCSRACQVANFKDHRTTCRILRARKELYRAGDLLKEMFHKLREAVFDLSIVEVIRDTNGPSEKPHLWLREGHYADIFTPFDALVPFPTDLFNNKAERDAVLSLNACSDAVGWMGNSVKEMLGDIASKIEESSLLMQDNAKFDLKIIHDDGSSRGLVLQHNVFKITLKQVAEEYVLDLSCAQFGLDTPVMPWATFLSSSVKKLFPRSVSGDEESEDEEAEDGCYSPLGTMRAQLMRHIGMPGSYAGAMEVSNIASVGLGSPLKIWGDNHKETTFRDAVRGIAKNWEERKAEILHQVDVSLAVMKTMNDQADAQIKNNVGGKFRSRPKH